MTHRVACILRALGNSSNTLFDYYQGLDSGTELLDPCAPMPPHFRDFTVDGTPFKLNYTQHMTEDHLHKAVLVTSMQPPQHSGKFDLVVVKFAHSYCKTTHEILAEKSLAPRLRYCEKAESVEVYVVIMGFINGEHGPGPKFDQQATNGCPDPSRERFCPR